MSTAEHLPASSRPAAPEPTPPTAASKLGLSLGLMHGGHAVAEGASGAAALAATVRSVTTIADADTADGVTTPFAYLFPDIASDPASHLPAEDSAATVAALDKLGEAMVLQDAAPDVDNPDVPPVYTYWGQFIDHDMTANTDRDSAVSDITKSGLVPLDPGFITANLRNLRRGTLDLDSVYGDGPSGTPAFYDDVKLRVGRVTVEGDEGANIPEGGERIPPDDDLARDLPRIGPLLDARVVAEDDFPPDVRAKPNFRQTALIGDGRNDENLIVAQFHTAFLRFHNAAVDWLAANVPGDRNGGGNPASFERARDLTRRHYQWLVVNDFLKTVAMPAVVDEVLRDGPKHYTPCAGKLFMPLEFSVACYRFGHSMVRDVYDHNRNFGAGPSPFIPTGSPFNLLFLFTGKSATPFAGQGPTLPFTWIIEWDRFTDKNPVPPPQGFGLPPRLARKIDTHIAFPLKEMRNETNGEPPDIKPLLQHLARRNLRRGYLLSIPTGQAVAHAMGVAPLTEAELRQGNDDAVNDALDQGGFIERTPLWYYTLKEAEVRAGGNSLGEVGSRVVCETIIGLLQNDRSSYLNVRGGWNPSKGVKLPGGGEIRTIRHFLRFAGVAA